MTPGSAFEVLDDALEEVRFLGRLFVARARKREFAVKTWFGSIPKPA